MKLLIAAAIALLLIVSDSTAAPRRSGDSSKRIIGTWLGPRRYWVFHADGRWGVLRYMGDEEAIQGRRWHIKGAKLILTFPVPPHMDTVVYTIDSLTPEKLIIEIDDRVEEYDRSS